MKYVNYDVVFQEIPDETTLAINISNCPNRCKGCHSAYLQEDIGEELTEQVLMALLDRFYKAITCVCFMGGDADTMQVARLALFAKTYTNKRIKTAWYSGNDLLPSGFSIENFDYIKLGSYNEQLGPLQVPTTNQRLYNINSEGEMTDITKLFQQQRNDIL